MRDRGYYGEFGGAYIPEILVATFDELVDAFEKAKAETSSSKVATRISGMYAPPNSP